MVEKTRPSQPGPQLRERQPCPKQPQELVHHPVDDRPLPRQVQPYATNPECIRIVEQQIPRELVDLVSPKPGRLGGRLAVKQQPVQDEVRIGSAQVRAADEHRPAHPP